MMRLSARRAGLVARSVLLAGLASACRPAAPASDAEKLARIEEMTAEVADRFPGAPQITVEEVGRLLEEERVVLVDVREERERAVSWIPGSITAAEYEADPGAWADRTVIAYCTIGHRSSEYAERMSAKGLPVSNLAGSILAWVHAGAPLVGPDGATHRIHVYGRAWDLAPEAYETIW